jgi:hypothetical protein
MWILLAVGLQKVSWLRVKGSLCKGNFSAFYVPTVEVAYRPEMSFPSSKTITNRFITIGVEPHHEKAIVTGNRVVNEIDLSRNRIDPLHGSPAKPNRDLTLTVNAC